LFDRGGAFGDASVGVGVVGDAVAEVLVEQPDGDGSQGVLDRGDLGEDVEAVGVLVDPALEAADLASDAP
jgi:hypothetical protein